VCPRCGCKCRQDFRSFWAPFWLNVVVLVAFFSATFYSQTFDEPSLPVIFALLALNVTLIATALWLVVVAVKLPLNRV
jgi:hypothetical protein